MPTAPPSRRYPRLPLARPSPPAASRWARLARAQRNRARLAGTAGGPAAAADGDSDTPQLAHHRQVETALRRREAQFQALIENVGSGVALIDAGGRFTLFNRQFLEMFGLTADADIHNVNSQDWSAWQVVDEAERTLHVDDHPVRRAALTLSSVRGQLVGVRRPSDGRLLWMLVSARPLLDAEGALEHLICTYHEVTELRQAEAEVRSLNERLRQADRRKDEFLAMLSHELRNPLAPIRNSLFILEHTAAGSPQARRAQEVIERQTRHLHRLVDDLLDVSRVARGKIRLHRERLELQTLVRRSVDDHRALFAHAGVRLEFATAPEPILVEADATRLAQVVGNLLANAAKFTPAGGATTVTVTRRAGEAEIRVRDTGIGIEPVLLPTLFQPFVQAESTLDRSHGGLGLGLAVLRGIVELHGGRVAVDSEGRGQGAEFVVTLPTVDAATADAGGDSAASAPPDQRRIVVIEDNVDAAETLRQVLVLAGHTVEVVHDGVAGIEKVRETRPDLVLCDIGLPGMSGFDVARVLRADPALWRTKLVALSGYAQPEDVLKSRQAGFDRHLAKPVDPASLSGIWPALP